MKTLLIILTIFISLAGKSQTTIKTSTVSVKGNCGECKERIENAADIKGVKNSVWSETTHVLSVTYDSKKVSLEQIEKAIAKAGHETATQKADSAGYKALPSCCKYESTDCKKK
jgi:copper chaperone CopZ